MFRVKYLLPLTILLITSASHATNKGKEAPPPKIEQGPPQQQQQNQNQHQSTDINNSNWLNNKLDQFNEQANRQSVMTAPTCTAPIANVTVGDVSVPLPGLAGMVHKSEYSGWGGAICGSVAIGAGKYKDKLDAQQISDKQLVDQNKQLADIIQRMQRQMTEQAREINKLQDRVSEK
jgi:hypothetical protein